MASAWSIIKRHLTQDTNPNSVKRQAALNKAADIFVELLDGKYFKDEDREKEAFNEDTELTQALTNRGFLNSLKDFGV